MAGAQSPVARGLVGASLFATGPRATVPLGRGGVSPSCPSSEARVHLNTVTWLYSRQAVLIELTGLGVYQACDRFIDLNSLQMEPSSHTKAE